MQAALGQLAFFFYLPWRRSTLPMLLVWQIGLALWRLANWPTLHWSGRLANSTPMYNVYSHLVYAVDKNDVHSADQRYAVMDNRQYSP
jgi:hypothetical protein